MGGLGNGLIHFSFIGHMQSRCRVKNHDITGRTLNSTFQNPANGVRILSG